MRRLKREYIGAGDVDSSSHILGLGMIKSRRRRDRPVWQRVDGRVYFTCPKCGEINDFTQRVASANPHSYIGADETYHGFDCVTCLYCRTHFIDLRFRRWDGPIRACCKSCRETAVGPRKRLLEDGWNLGRLSFCPGCAFRYEP